MLQLPVPTLFNYARNVFLEPQTAKVWHKYKLQPGGSSLSNHQQQSQPKKPSHTIPLQDITNLSTSPVQSSVCVPPQHMKEPPINHHPPSNQNVEDPPSSHQDVKDPPSSHQDVKHPPSSHQDVKHPPSSHQDVKDPPSSHQDVKHPPSSHQDVKHPPSSHQDVKDPPSSHQDVKHPPSSHQDVKHPPSSHQDVKDPPPSHQHVSDPLPTNHQNLSQVCPQCGKKYAYQSGLSKHIRKEHRSTGLSGQISCSKCNKRYMCINV